jgi:hypothetical protein
VISFQFNSQQKINLHYRIKNVHTKNNHLQMNFFEDAFRFLGNLNKEASAKHILIKGPGWLQTTFVSILVFFIS